MQSEIIEGNESPKQEDSENINWEQFIKDRGGDNTSQEAESSSQGEEVDNTKAEAGNQTTSESDGNNTTDLVLSQLDLDSLSKEQIGELAQKLNSRTLSRFGELTAKRKAAEEELAKIKGESNKEEAPRVKNNPLSGKSTEELNQAKEQAEELIEWADNVLYEHEDSGANEVIAEVEGKEFTKAEVKKSLRHHQNVIKKYIPARVADIQKEGQNQEMAQAFGRQAVKELAWLKDEKNPITQKFKAMAADPRVKDMQKEVSPEMQAQLPYLLAHAANSIYGRKLVHTAKPVIPRKINKQPTITPNKTGKPVVAKSDKPQNRASKVIGNAMSKFAASGDKNDFISLRTQQLSKH
tara:strand:- start:1004 stop:2059 length:1056 start_codon:yes stop_codon:yes gene_type:complete